MAGTIKVGQLTDGTSTVSMEAVIKGTSKAWVNFTGLSGVSVRKSYNVTSIVENSTGKYTVNFTNAMADATYAVCGTAKRTNNNSAGTDNQSIFIVPSLYTTTSCHVITCSVSAVLAADIVNVAVFD